MKLHMPLQTWCWNFVDPRCNNWVLHSVLHMCSNAVNTGLWIYVTSPPIYSAVHCGLSADCPAVHSGDTQARPVQAGQCRAGTCTPCQPTHTLTSPPSHLPPPPSSLLSARSACLQPVIHPQERLKLGPETRTSGLQSENYQTPLSLSLLCWGTFLVLFRRPNVFLLKLSWEHLWHLPMKKFQRFPIFSIDPNTIKDLEATRGKKGIKTTI